MANRNLHKNHSSDKFQPSDVMYADKYFKEKMKVGMRWPIDNAGGAALHEARNMLKCYAISYLKRAIRFKYGKVCDMFSAEDVNNLLNLANRFGVETHFLYCFFNTWNDEASIRYKPEVYYKLSARDKDFKNLITHIFLDAEFTAHRYFGKGYIDKRNGKRLENSAELVGIDVSFQFIERIFKSFFTDLLPKRIPSDVFEKVYGINPVIDTWYENTGNGYVRCADCRQHGSIMAIGENAAVALFIGMYHRK